MSKAGKQLISALEEALRVARGQDKPYRVYRIHPPIPAERREAAGKIGDENAPQTQGPEVDARRLPDVQTP